MKPFEYYLKNKNVRKVSINIQLAKSLVDDIAQRTKEMVKLDAKNSPKIIFENIYDSLREFSDAILAIDGFKSYSHEASIAYLKKYNFSDAEISALDRFRYKRNGSKYYGKKIYTEDCEDIEKFYKEIQIKFNLVLKNKFEGK